jgi:hypothetical protein
VFAKLDDAIAEASKLLPTQEQIEDEDDTYHNVDNGPEYVFIDDVVYDKKCVYRGYFGPRVETLLT